MIDKRRFLQAGLALACAGRKVRAAEPEVVLPVRQTTLQLTQDGPSATVLRYDAATPLTLVRPKQGQELALRISNTLVEPTSFRLCGLRGQGSLNGTGLAPPDAIEPGSDAVVRFTPSESGLGWFRPALGSDGQAARGLNGVMIVDPVDAISVDQDLVCLLEDWQLDAKGQIAADAGAPGSSTLAVTASKKPIPTDFAFAPGSRIRVRLINASVRRVMVVACEGVKPSVIAIDGQPSELFQPSRDTVPIGPGARFELLVDLPRDPDQIVRLILRGSESVNGSLEADRPLWTFKTAGAALAPKQPAAPLQANTALPTRIPLEKSKRADLAIAASGDAWTINGVNGIVLPKQPVLRVKQGDAVTLGLINTSAALVSLTLYGVAVRLLHPLDDGWEPYWRDTLLLPPGSRNHVAFVADRPGRWLVESGFQDQAVKGLRCWLDVTRG